nr:hypothetical protein [Tanacetum cinerariifolium]
MMEMIRLSCGIKSQAGSESRPPMLNKENYVLWSSRLLRRMIPEPSDANREFNLTETFHLQTDDELSDKELKQIEANDQAIQSILPGLPEDMYAAVDSCETAQEIWLRVQQMMKGSDIGIQQKKAKLFNEWERFTSYEGESIESYYHRFLKLMNDLKRNKHFPEKIASNLKFLNNLRPKWSRHRISSNPRNMQIAQTGMNMGQDRQMKMVGGHYARNYTVRPRRRDAAYLQTQLLIAQKEEAGIQLQVEEHDLMAAAADLDEIEEVNANCILMANLHRDKMKQMNKEIKLANYTKINNLSGVFVPQMALSREELYFSNNSKTANVSKSFSIPNEDLSDDTTPSVARKFINQVKSTIVTLQRVIKQIMTIETHDWSSSAHQELHKIIRDEIFPIVNQVDARLQNFEIQFLKEAAKFVGDFKSPTNEADASLAKHKALELESERLLKAVISQDIMIIVQNEPVVDTSDL